MPAKDNYERAKQDYIQDSFENCPFSSVGGLENRHQMIKPEWISEEDGPEYIRGYTDMAKEHLGEDWMTCQFGWSPALVINPREEGG